MFCTNAKGTPEGVSEKCHFFPNDHVEGFITPADEKRACVGWISAAHPPSFLITNSKIFPVDFPIYALNPLRSVRIHMEVGGGNGFGGYGTGVADVLL